MQSFFDSSGKAGISVIVPHFDQLDFLDACLGSLERQTLPRERFEIVVVDNASPCGLASVEKITRGRARLVTETEKGAGPARNRGVAETNGSVLAFIDADCVADSQWLAEGVRGLAKFDLVGGRVDVSVADEANMTGSEAFERVFAFDTEDYIRRKGFTITGNLFSLRTTFEIVGGFRTGVSEDIEWCRRAVGMGFTLGYHEEASISHPARSSWPELKRKWSRMNRQTLMLARDRPFGTLGWMARAYLLPLSIVPDATKILASEKLPDAMAKARGLATMARMRLWRFADAHRAVREAHP